MSASTFSSKLEIRGGGGISDRTAKKEADGKIDAKDEERQSRENISEGRE